MLQNLIFYSFKVWVTSVLVAPILYLVLRFCQNANYQISTNVLNQELEIYIVYVVFGGIFSFCTWLLFTLVIKIIVTFCSSIAQINYMIVVAGVLLSAGTFAVFLPFSFNIHDEFFYLMLSNCVL